MPEGINFVEHVMKVENTFRHSGFSRKVYGRPSYGEPMMKPMMKTMMHSMDLMSSDVATAVPELMAYEMPSTESASLDRPTKLRKKVEEAKGSYMDTVFEDIAKAVDRHSKLSSGTE